MFDGNTEIFKYDIKNISLKYLIKIIKNTTRKAIIIVLLTTYNNTAEDLKWFYKNKGNKKKIRPLENLVPAWRNKYIITIFKLLLIPPNTPLKYLFIIALIMAIPRNTSNKSLLNI